MVVLWHLSCCCDVQSGQEPQGITGLNYIQITAGNPQSAILKTQYPDNVVPVIQSQPSPIAELLSGSGTVLGVLLGCLLLGTINVALAVLGVAATWQLLVYGVVILIALLVDMGIQRTMLRLQEAA